jgi:protein phosphatase
MEDTAELANQFANTFFAPYQPDWAVHVAGASHQGLVREKNEDRFIAIRRCRSRDVLATNLDPRSLSMPQDFAYVMVVADGVGGAAHGEFASQLALETAVELGTNATSWVMKIGSIDAQQIRARTDAYISVIQETLLSYAQSTPELRGMGTTWTSAYVVPPHAIIIHVGDSRAYQFHDQKLQQITRDQTLAQQMIDAGSPPESVSKLRSVLTNCLGGQSGNVSAELYKLTLDRGDQLLLCSDGLSDMVDDDEIGRVLSAHADPQQASDQLIQSALNNGGKDNVTVVLCSIGSTKEGQAS